jgi:membrane protein
MTLGVGIVGLGGDTVPIAQRLLAATIAFGSIWTLFLLAYRYVPARKTPWRTSLVAATFAAFAHELLKLAFSTYVTELANYTSTLGNLATAAILLLWIYYGALVFIVGGEVAHVYTMLRARRAAVSQPS